MIRHAPLLTVLLCLWALCWACSQSTAPAVDGDEDTETSPDGDQEADGEEEPVWPDGDQDADLEEDGDIDQEWDGEQEHEADGDLDEADGDQDDEQEAEAELAEPLILPPRDGRLYAAAGITEITPTEANHPCTRYIAGRAQNRQSQGVHTPLTARSFILAQDDRYLVLVLLDIIGLSQADTDRIAAAFPVGALMPERLVIASTHTHNGPDTIGLWGPNYFQTGRCEAYIDHLAERVRELIEETAGRLVAVTMTSAVTRVYEQGLTRPRLMRDMRYPYIYNDNFTTARFADDEGKTVATLANWHSHPEIMIHHDTYSADWPHYLRESLERHLGGTAIYITGTLGGLLTSFTQGIEIPSWTEEGERVEHEGAPVYIKVDGDAKARSLGYELADYLISALATAEPQDGDLHLAHRTVLLPITNEDIQLASQIGLVTISERLVTDRPDECGAFGCLAQPILHARIADLHVVTIPGELFPESSVGRKQTIRDYGEPWGEHVFEAITGYRESLAEGHLLIEAGLANNEIGYIVPASDFHPKDHPNYYEETSAISREAEALIRGAIRDMLAASPP